MVEVPRAVDACAALIAACPDAALVFDGDGRCVGANAAAAALFGVPADALRGTPASRLVADADGWQGRAGSGWRGTARLRRADGAVVAAEAWSAVLPGAGGPLVALFARSPAAVTEADPEGDISGTRFGVLVEQIPAVVSLNANDEVGSTLYISPRVRDVLGYDPDELTADPGAWVRQLHPDDRDGVLAEIARTNASGESCVLEYRRFARDGRAVWMRETSAPVRDSDGRIRYWQSVATDVTDAKRAEAEAVAAREAAERAAARLETLNGVGRLLAAELDLDRLLQAVVDAGVELTGAAFGAFFYNAVDERGEAYALYTLSGAPRSAFAGYPMPRATAIFGPTFRGEAPVRLDDVRADPRFGQNPPYRGMPAGHLPVASYLAVPVASRDGGVLGGLFFGHPDPAVFGEEAEALAVGLAAHAAVALDNARLLEAARAAQATVAANEARFRSLLANAPDPVVVLDAAGTVTFASPAVERVLGCPPAAVVGAAVFGHLDPDEAPAVRGALAEMAASPGARMTAEVRMRHAGGPWRRVEATAQSLLHDPAVSGFVVNLRDVTERREAEDALRESEERYRTLVENLPVLVYEQPVGPARRPRYVSPQVGAMYGYTPEEWDATRPHRMHPDDRARAEAEMARTDATGEPFRIEYRERGKDGRYRWVRDEAVLVRDAAGDPDYWLGVKLDVSDRIAAEEAARAAEGRYRAILDGLPLVVYEMPTGTAPRPRYVNARVADLLGYSPEEWTSDWLARVHPDDLPRIAAADERTEATGEPFCEEYRERAKDGSWVWVRDEGVLVRDAAGNPDHWLGVKQGVGERRAAEADRARLAAIVASADDAILSKSLDGTVRTWNAAAERMYGWAASEIVGRPIAAIVPPERMAELVGILRRIGRGERVERLETVRVARDGRRLDVALTVSPIHDAEGRVVAAAAVARDVTDQKRARDELVAAKEAAEEASRVKGQFLSTMSHELRTPMNAIVGYAHLLLDGLDGDLTPEQAADVGQIAAGADRLLALINDLLDLSKIEAGRLELSEERVDLAEVVAEACDGVRPQAAAKGLELVVLLPPGLPPVQGDPLRLRQILLNLLGNAVKFTERGRVVVGAREAGDGTVDVWVADTGIGIAPADLPRVFDEFRQADGGTTRKYGGTGLGLAISRRLAELQGAGLVARSQPGAGSTFTLVVPMADATPAGAARSLRSA